ncbi:MAG: hypothetical protein KKD38_06860, partial [Candidatus Delongbacteria bacterium]|nr:hypothetical protein [Candidatus Delongbacteria bacterium]
EETDFSKPPAEKDSTFDYSKIDLRKFRFTKNMLNKTAEEVLTEEQKIKLKEPKPYEIKFTPDIITVNAGYSTGYGVVGSAYLQFSDYLSNHSFVILTDLNQDLLNSNLGLYYYFLKKRMNFGIGLSHDVVYYYVLNKDYDPVNDPREYIDYRDRLLGFHLMAQYPFSRYTRVDSDFNVKSIVNEVYDWSKESYRHDSTNTLLTLGSGFSYDNVIWGYYGPENGTRIQLNALHTSEADDPLAKETSTIEFTTFTLDYRKYLRVKGDYHFAFRFSGGISEGKTPQQFYLGGLSNWLNYRYNSDYEFDTVVDKYYSSREYPLRGFRLLEKSGNRYALLNTEFRYPFVKYLLLGFPLPVALGNINGVVFSDFGSAWTNEDFRGVISLPDGSHKLNDLLFSSGIGSRMNVGYFIIRYDVSWTWDFNSACSKPWHIFSLGANF